MDHNHLKHAVIYVRVSTKEQVDEGNSLSTQQKICLEYANKQDYEIREIFVEQGESAKTADRPELQRLLEFCADKKNGIKAIIIYKLDRLSRNTDDYSQLRLLLKRYGVEIKSTSEHFENTPVGRFMENTMANIAQFDNDIRAERCAGGMREAMRDGRYVWMAPLGYRNVKIAGRATIEQDEVRATLVKRAYDLVALNTYTTEDIRRLITKEGLLNKKGKPVSKTHFYALLSNELFTGWINKFGERHRGKFAPIVSDDLFAHVQRILKAKGRKHAALQMNHPDFPLRKFVVNGQGQKLTGSWSKGRSKKYPYYRFGGKDSNFKKEDLEKAYMAYIDKYRLSEAKLKKLKELAYKNLVQATIDKRQEIENLKKRLEDLKTKQSGLITKNLEGVISDNVLKQQLDQIDKEMLDISSLLASLSVSENSFKRIPKAAEDFLLKPGNFWKNTKIEIKTKLQWFQFPQGVTFQNNIFGTAEICCIFNTKDAFSASLSSKVDSRNSITNQEYQYWQKFARDCDHLNRILKDKKLNDLEQPALIKPRERNNR